MTPEVVQGFLRTWPQLAACMTVTLLSISFGLVIGWTSPYLALLTSENSPLFLTDEEASWVVSLMPLGRVFGAVAGSIAMQYYGSKTSLIISGTPVMIGWVCIIFADSACWLYVSRTAAGISLGMYYSCFAIFMGEIASTKIRGALVSMVVNGTPFGTLIGTVMGSRMSMRNFGIISLVLNISYMTIFPLLPQSPYYYVRNDNTIKARKTIEWYYRKGNTQDKLETIENFVRASESQNWRHTLEQMSEKKNRRIFTIIILLFVFVQLSGLNTFIFYMEIIVRDAQVTVMEPATVVILCNTMGIIVSWISVCLIDVCGRKILIMISCTSVTIATALLGLHFMLLEQNVDPKSLEWLPIASLMLFTLVSIGFVPVPSTILSELSPDNLKSIVGFSASVMSALFAFISSKTYQPMIDMMTEKYVFWIYALIMLVAMISLGIILPETKGKTLQEIQDMIAKQTQKTEKQKETRGK